MRWNGPGRASLSARRRWSRARWISCCPASIRPPADAASKACLAGQASLPHCQEARASEAAHHFAMADMGRRKEDALLDFTVSYLPFVGRRTPLDGGHWFAFDLAVTPGQPNQLSLRFWLPGPESRYNWEVTTKCKFDVLVDGKKLGAWKPKGKPASGLAEARFALPQEITAGKQKVNIRLEAPGGRAVPPLVECRMSRE